MAARNLEQTPWRYKGTTPVPNRPRRRTTSMPMPSASEGFETRNPHHPLPIRNDFQRGAKQRDDILMSPTLHDPAPDFYYGQWLRRFGRDARGIRRSIAQRGPAPYALIHSIFRPSAL